MDTKSRSKISILPPILAKNRLWKSNSSIFGLVKKVKNRAKPSESHESRLGDTKSTFWKSSIPQNFLSKAFKNLVNVVSKFQEIFLKFAFSRQKSTSEIEISGSLGVDFLRVKSTLGWWSRKALFLKLYRVLGNVYC